MHPIAGMTARLGAGYEKITWDDGSDPTEGWTANLNLMQKVGETVSLKAVIDLGQSEDRYTAGTEFLLADNGNSNSRLGLEYSYIVDKDGGDDDQRLTAYWRMGFGEGSDHAASAAMGYGGDVTLPAEAGYDHDSIMTAVMEKPDYLPTSALTKDVSENSEGTFCPITVVQGQFGATEDLRYEVNGPFVQVYTRWNEEPTEAWVAALENAANWQMNNSPSDSTNDFQAPSPLWFFAEAPSAEVIVIIDAADVGIYCNFTLSGPVSDG
ncbi:MAG: hypothetical protein Q8M47_02480 [Devosia sp.]|nr:hypothetical protein [Devosia sp.]